MYYVLTHNGEIQWDGKHKRQQKHMIILSTLFTTNNKNNRTVIKQFPQKIKNKKTILDDFKFHPYSTQLICSVHK